MPYYYTLKIVTEGIVKTTIPPEKCLDEYIYHYKELNNNSHKCILEMLSLHLHNIESDDYIETFMRFAISRVMCYLRNLDQNKWKDWPIGNELYHEVYDHLEDLYKIGVEFKSTYVPDEGEWVEVTP